jgi:hypothetical protein
MRGSIGGQERSQALYMSVTRRWAGVHRGCSLRKSLRPKLIRRELVDTWVKMQDDMRTYKYYTASYVFELVTVPARPNEPQGRHADRAIRRTPEPEQPVAASAPQYFEHE